jgi:hypothetical protein
VGPGLRHHGVRGSYRVREPCRPCPSYRTVEQHLEAASQLKGDQLAFAAALLELDTEGKLVGNADAIFGHALTFSADIADPATTLNELESNGLVVTAQNEWRTAVAAGWGPRTQAVIQGRAGDLLARVPVPRFAENAFWLVLSDALNGFSAARFGIGSPSLGALGRMADGASPHAGTGCPFQAWSSQRCCGHVARWTATLLRRWQPQQARAKRTTGRRSEQPPGVAVPRSE